jgi:hypothetical protein
LVPYVRPRQIDTRRDRRYTLDFPVLIELSALGEQTLGHRNVLQNMGSDMNNCRLETCRIRKVEAVEDKAAAEALSRLSREQSD